MSNTCKYIAQLEKIAQENFFKPTLAELVIKNGRIGTVEEIFSYCNQLEFDGDGFLFKCNPDCKHNAPDQS